MKKTTKEIEQKAIELYSKGLSCKAIAKELPIESTTVFNILKRNDIQTRTSGGIDELPIDTIIEDYKNGVPTTVLAERYKVNVHTICNYLEKENIKRDNIYHNKQLNRGYFENIDSYDKAYFLGFMITDGCVGSKTNEISLSISSKDDEILEIFKSKLNSKNPIHRTVRVRKGRKDSAESSLKLKSQQLKDDLAKYNVVPNKTYTIEIPEIDENLTSHLFRGLFDGDGWISYKSHAIGFCGNEKCVQYVHDYLVSKLGVYDVKVLHTDTHLWQCVWGSQKDIQLIGEYLYKDKKDCYLKRKYNNYIDIVS